MLSNKDEGTIKNVVDIFRQNILIIFFTILLIAGGVTQSVSLPLWITSFGNNFGGPYFILLFSSMFYVLTFFTTTVVVYCIALRRYKKGLGKEPYFHVDGKSMKIFCLIGFFDAINGIIIVYSSNPDRTPPILQAIFPNVSILYSIIATKIFIPSKKINYFSWQPIVAILLVIISVILNILPDFLSNLPFSTGKDPLAWSIFFIIGVAPGVFYNVLQELFLRDDTTDPLQTILNSTWVLYWGCFYQLITMIIFFWVDFIPWFGLSSSAPHFFENFSISIVCFLGGKNCGWAPLKYGLLFNIGYATGYCASIGLNIESANYSSLLSTLVSPVAVLYWVIFPNLDFPVPVWWSFAFPAIFYLVASVLWKVWEKNEVLPNMNPTPRYTELNQTIDDEK